MCYSHNNSYSLISLKINPNFKNSISGSDVGAKGTEIALISPLARLRGIITSAPSQIYSLKMFYIRLNITNKKFIVSYYVLKK